MPKIKLAIVGSRTITDYSILRRFGLGALEMVGFTCANIERIVSGGAIGVDALAERLSDDLWLDEPIIHKPDYKNYPSNVAPLERNTLIADDCDAAIVIWDGKSGGTWNTVSKLRGLAKPFILINVLVWDQRRTTQQVARSIEFHGDWKRLYEERIHPKRSSRKPVTTH